jgi:hypothetical protein
MDTSALPDTSYATDYGDCDTSALNGAAANFVFDSSHLKAGQRIEVITQSGVSPNQPILPAQIRLQQQAMTGVVSGFTALPGGNSSFDLLLPDDSYVTLLSGERMIHVVEQSRTDNRAGAFADGNTIRVRGPLFWTGTQFSMVARRITK